MKFFVPFFFYLSVVLAVSNVYGRNTNGQTEPIRQFADPIDQSSTKSKGRLATKTILPTSGVHSATVIFFHGSGGNAEEFEGLVSSLLDKTLTFPHIKIVYPTAPAQPYTPSGGELSNVWFDRYAIDINEREHLESVYKIYESVRDLIDDEVKQGIPLNRIIVGGFSMGGALALHTAFNIYTDLGGMFACSSFLNRNSIIYESLKNRKNSTDSTLPELRLFHGDRDTLVPQEWASETFNELSQLGVEGEFTIFSNTIHELKKQELTTIENWILSKLPPKNNGAHNNSGVLSKISFIYIGLYIIGLKLFISI